MNINGKKQGQQTRQIMEMVVNEMKMNKVVKHVNRKKHKRKIKNLFWSKENMEEKRKAARMKKTGSKKEIKKHISRKAGRFSVKWMKIQKKRLRGKKNWDEYIFEKKEGIFKRKAKRKKILELKWKNIE